MKPILFVLALIVGGLMTQGIAQTQACSTPEHRQFDFWVGDWQVFDYSSGSKGKLAGTNRVEKILKGCVVQENWVGAGGSSGSSFNSFSDGLWHQTWVDDTGFRLELAGAFRDGRMVLEGRSRGERGETVLERITWGVVNNNPNEVRQFWQQSRDEGKTWTVAFDGLYVRK